jgi:glycerate dehydrogenase
MVFAHILNIYNRVDHYTNEIREQDAWVKSKDFSYYNTPLLELYGKKIGIVGLGNTGSATARIAIGFGMEVYAYTSKSEFQLPHEIKKLELDELFRQCDIISLHCPLTPTTNNLVNAERLKLMKPTAIVINTSRGPVVNAHDLAEALNNGQIMAAGIDVLETEPPKADNPLLKAKNCYITPHIAWASQEARVRLMDIMVGNVKAFIEGNPVNIVN